MRDNLSEQSSNFIIGCLGQCEAGEATVSIVSSLVFFAVFSHLKRLFSQLFPIDNFLKKRGHSKKTLTALAARIVYGFATVFLLFLCITTVIFRSDGYEVAVNSQEVCIRVAIAVGALILLYFVVDKVEKSSLVVQYGMLLALFAGILFFCFWWIMNSAYMPASDAKAIYYLACCARSNDLRAIVPVGSYMALWPFQSGIVMFMETLLRLVPGAGETKLQLIYLPFMAFSLICGYMLVRRLFRDKKIGSCWCILMASCLPYYLYVNNMYGEIPSMALTLFSIWMATEFLSKPCWWKGMLVWIGMAGAVAIRKNVLIVLTACLLVLMVIMLQKRQKRILFLGVIIILAAMAGNILPKAFYEYRAQNKMGNGVPAVSYIAMGLQWTEGRSPGAWNGYHSELFEALDYDRNAAIEASEISIRESLEYMGRHPGYTAKFFSYKLTEQWCREDFSCLYATLNSYENRSDAAWKFYDGPVKDRLLDIMSIHQGIIYFGALLFCIIHGIFRRNEEETGSLWRLVLLIAFIGGFLFSIIWEAGARYVMPYYVMLIPYAADGWMELGGLMERRWGEVSSRPSAAM